MNIQNVIKNTTENLSVEDISELLRTQMEDLISLHHTLGQDIRNNYDLWFNEPLCLEFEKYIGYNHPDDISMYIIEQVWTKLQEEYKSE